MTTTIYLNTTGKEPVHEINARIQEIDNAGGGTLVVDGEHLLRGGIFCTINNTLTIDFRETGKFTLDTGANWPAVKLHNRENPHHGVVNLVNPRVDCSRGSFTGGTDTSTALVLDQLAAARVYNPYLYGGEIALNGHADSGMVPISVLDFVMIGGTIKGFNDYGVYVSTPGSPMSPKEVTVIQNTTFENCRAGVTIKRRAEFTKVIDCDFIECNCGVRSDWVGQGPTPPGKEFYVENCSMIRCEGAIFLEGPTTGVFKNIFIEDFGFEAANKRRSSSYDAAITLSGADSCLFKGVTIRQKNYPSNVIGIQIEKRTEDGNTYKGGDSVFKNVSITNVKTAVEEKSGVKDSKFNLKLRNVDNQGKFSSPMKKVTIKKIGVKKKKR